MKDKFNPELEILVARVKSLEISMAGLGRCLEQTVEELVRAGIVKRPGVPAQGTGRGAEDQDEVGPVGKE